MENIPVIPKDLAISSFVKRSLIVLVIGALALAVWRLADLLVLLFGAILIAVGLNACATGLTRATRIGRPATLSFVVIVALALFTLALWFFGRIAVDQVGELRLRFRWEHGCYWTA